LNCENLMKTFELIKLAEEAERYPALLAWYQHVQKPDGDLDLSYPVRWLGDAPEEESAETAELFDRYLERGEIGAAQFLIRKYPELPSDKVIRRRSQLKQQLDDALLNARDALVQLKEANAKLGEEFAERLDAIDGDPVQINFRPGWALGKIKNINSELQDAIIQERERVMAEVDALRVTLRDNNDIETAVKRIEELVNVPEGLATAARLLDIAKRAESGIMSQDDIRLLYSSSADGVRLVRPWSELKVLATDASGPTALAERLEKEAFAKRLRLPAEFDRDKLRDLLLALSDHHAGTINTNIVADRLGSFLGIHFRRVEGQRGSYGSHFPFAIASARHKEFSGSDRKLYLTVPLRGTDPSALSQLYRTVAATDGGKALPILLYPGIADSSRALSQQIGVNQTELLFLDCIDLLRIAEVPIAQRVIAFQQVLLPRMPSLGRRTYQTGGPVASELFRGRQKVIDELTSPRGKTVLFSGRMMGKSSVLGRIRDRIDSSSSDEKHRCVLLSASTGALLEPLLDKLLMFLPMPERDEKRRHRERLATSPQDQPAKREEKESGKLELLRQVIERICADGRLTILVDEADKFAKDDSAKERKHSLAWLLRDLENHSPDKLRIVFAGFQTLHHEVIAANGAFANWFNQCQLGPLERDEAFSLIKEPLADFGVQFVSDAGVERILEFSGGYPLLIQEVCARLMERAMARRTQSIKPGDEIQLLRAGEVDMVCRDEALRTRLHQVLSLNLDQYPRLKLVIYLILQSGMYRSINTDFGQADVFKIEDVQAMLVDWYGEKLSEYFSETSLPGLVEELESLGLVTRHGDGYRFLNRTFSGMLRDNPGFESELLSLIDQVANPCDNEARRYWSLPTEHLETLLRSRNHTLLVGLPATLKSQIVQTLFSRERGSSSLLLEDPMMSSARALEDMLHRQLGEKRKTLSLGDLCVKAKIKMLVLDCPALPLSEIRDISEELAKRADIRLVATGDVKVARQFVHSPLSSFELVAVRRLRPQDIQAWGEQPYRKLTGREFSLVIDHKTAKALLSVTCGYFPLLQNFRGYCERVMTRASEYYPSEAHVEGFRKELPALKLKEVLLAPLTDTELKVLKMFLEQAVELEPAQPRLDRDFAQELLFDSINDEAELVAHNNAIQLLLQLDLMTEQHSCYVFDNFRLLKVAFGI
jgi:hypothetical protein